MTTFLQIIFTNNTFKKNIYSCYYHLVILYVILLFLIFTSSVQAITSFNKQGVCVIKLGTDNQIVDIISVSNNISKQFDISSSSIIPNQDICEDILHQSIHAYKKQAKVEYFTELELNKLIVTGNTEAIGVYYFPIKYQLKDFISFIKYKTNYVNKEIDFTIRRNNSIINNSALTSANLENNDIVFINKFYEKIVQPIKKPSMEAKKLVANQATKANNKQQNKQSVNVNNKANNTVKTAVKLSSNTDPTVKITALKNNDKKDYFIMSGDILQINLPGEKEFNKNFLVGRDGEINLPEVGSVTINGLTVSQAIDTIYNKLATVFLGVNKLTVQLKEKRILIKVLGYVMKPGEVDLPADANIQMAVNAVGGFKDGAMLSKIQLIRGNKKSDVNLKKYLETGNESYLPKLKTLDILFIPSSPYLSDIYGDKVEKQNIDPTQDKSAIKIIGEVISPGSLAYKEKMTAVDALLLAGGVTRYADDTNIRVINSGKPLLFDLSEYMKYGDKINAIHLDKGATIYVPIKEEEGAIDDPTENPDSIKVFGEVAKPGVHKYKKGVSLVDLLLLSGGVTRYANVEQIRIIAKGDPQLFNLKSYLDSGTKLPTIEPGSTIFVPKQVEAISSGESVVYIMGQVHRPGSYETGKDVNFLDVLANAGGPDRFADTRSIRVLRKSGEVLKFNLDEYSEGVITSLPEVNKGDSILVPRKSGDDQGWLKFKSSQTIKIIGSVKTPGRYPWSDNIDFMDLLAHAGGTGDKADIAHIKLMYSSQNGEIRKQVFNLQGFLDGDDKSKLPELEGGLTIMIPELPTSPTDNKSQWVLLAKEQAIYILGAINSPGRYAFNERLDLMDILTAADGPKDDADMSNITVVHRSGSKEKLSSVNLIEYFDTGDESLLPNVKPGDSIYVHSRDASTMSKEQTITVLGEVNKTGKYVYKKGITLIDVLSEAGGTKNTADREKIIIKRMNEQQIVFDLQEYMDNSEEVSAPILYRGDTIYVADNSSSIGEIIRSFLKDLAGLLPLILLFSGGGSG